MSIYIADYLEPLLVQMRIQGQLKKGKKKIKIQGKEVEYTGELDRQGRATGFGKASYSQGFIEGTFFNDCTEGVCTLIYPLGKRIGERKSSLLHGKGTMYDNDGRIFNVLWRNNVD